MPEEHSARNWIRVSRASPCPVCGKPDNCEVSRDGVMAWCGRIADGAIKDNAGGQYLHRLLETSIRNLRPEPSQRETVPPRDYSALAERLYHEGAAERSLLAKTLGVEASALDRLHVGWNKWEQYWSFPERDGVGRVIGISARHLNASKRRLPRGKSGLTYACDWDSGNGPIFLVEGASDTAALMTIGLNVIGRPSNTGGTELLIEVLESIHPARPIVVVGERDQKPDGLWPGQDGAIRTATKLVQGLSRVVHWALPPDECKDSREWLNLMRANQIPDARLQSLFLDGLQQAQISPPPIIRHIERHEPTVSVAAWRELMLQARISSLSRPGYYLDASATGAGKSSIDLVVVLHALNREAG